MSKRDQGPTLVEPKIKKVTQVLADAIDELVNPPRGTPLSRWPDFQRRFGGFRPHEYSIVCGATGCLGGDTEISVNRGGKGYKIRIRDLYQRTRGIGPANENFDPTVETQVRSYDGARTRLHKINDVILSGIKETWRLRADQGKTIRLTPCHRVLTQRGWVAARDLRADEDRIAADQDKPLKSGKVRARLTDTYFQGVKHHPHHTNAKNIKRIVKHRAIFEANVNGLALEEFLRICRSNKARAEKLKFVNPRTHHVHHKDHNHSNNDVKNLELMTIEAHRFEHGNADHFNSGSVRWVTFRGFDRVGVEAVYDISCADPHHNFVADGLIVHNSGKTAFIASMSAQLVEQNERHFVMSIETGHLDFVRRVASVFAKVDLNDGDGLNQSKQDSLMNLAVPVLKNGALHLSEYDNRLSVEQLMHDLRYAREKLGCRVAFIDNLNFLLTVDKFTDVNQEMDRVTHELIIFCKRIDMHIVMIMHPKKNSNPRDLRVESEFEIKGSSTAVQEAQNIFLFNRPKSDDGAHSKFEREVIIAKMRRRGQFVHESVWFEYRDASYFESANQTRFLVPVPNAQTGEGAKWTGYKPSIIPNL